MRQLEFVRVAVVLGALALPACSGAGSNAAAPVSATSAAAGSSVVPLTALRQPASLRGNVAKASPLPIATATPSTVTAAAVVKSASVRGLIDGVVPTPNPDH